MRTLFTLMGLLFSVLFISSCSVSQKSTSQRNNTKVQAKDIGKQHNHSIQGESIKPLDTFRIESLRKDISAGVMDDTERKLGIAIGESDSEIALYIEAAKWIGVRYKYNGMERSGTDCSGLTYQLYKVVYGKKLRRSSAEMAKYDVKDIAKSSLRTGDLVFFATSNKTKAVTHVGVYLKDNRFIHASTKAGVVVNSLNDDYYRKTFVKCGRVE